MGASVKGTSKPHAKIAAILSFLLMGLGQVYNRQFVKGITYILLEVYILIFWSVPFQWAMWGLTTLGETPQVRQRGKIVDQGDHSIFLMIEGIIAVIMLVLLICFYIMQIRDAYKVGKLREEGTKPNNFKQMMKNVYENGFAYILITPSVIFTSFLTILPLLFGVLIAFTNYSGPNHLPPKKLVDWVGFQTFIDLFQLKTWSTTFYGVFTWTILWAVLATATTFFIGLLFAVFINNRGIKLKKFWRSIFILPWAIPQFVSVLIFRNIFNGQFGPINQYLEAIGLNSVAWLSDPFTAKVTLVLVNMWLGFPYWMILMSGVMTSIDKELYEASEVDGASAWQKFWKVTFPIVMFSTAPLLIMSFASNFNNFNIIYLFTQGNPVNTAYSYAGSTDILISWIYKLTLEQNQYAMASVVSILIFFVIATLSIINFRKTRAFKEEDMMS